MLSACVRVIKIWFPYVELDVRTSTPDIWKHNPHLTKLDENDPSVWELDMQYETIHQSNEQMGNHFIHGFIQDFNERTGYAVKLTQFKGDMHLTEEEKAKKVFDEQEDQFVVVIAGGKTDYKTKMWWNEAWTEVVENCPDIQFIQVGKISADDHKHEEIKAKNCVCKLGKTSWREVMRLVYQSVGTLSVVTGIMHTAVAFDRRSAVVAGGHEPWWWEKCPGQDYFHTIGQLPCCRFGGCWKGECENKNEKDRQRCLELIDPKKVAKAIRKWF